MPVTLFCHGRAEWGRCITHLRLSLNVFNKAEIHSSSHSNLQFDLLHPLLIQTGSQIPVCGLTGRALGGLSAAPGAGFCGQNLGIKCISCEDTHL